METTSNTNDTADRFAAKLKDKMLEATENKSDVMKKTPIVSNNSVGKKGDKSKVVQSRKHSVKSSLVKPLHIAKGEKLKEVERLLEDFLKQTLPEKGNKRESHTSQSETKMTKQEKRERRRIARAMRESLKDIQTPKRIVLGFSCVVKKINRNAIKAVIVDPQIPQNLLQILQPLALGKSLPVIGIENLGLLTKNVLGFKVSALGLCDHQQSCSQYSKLLANVLEMDISETREQSCHYQKATLD